MTDDKKDLEVVLSEQVRAQMAADPELAAAIREMSAIFRQADHAVKTGQHKTFEDAIEALTGERPQPVDLDDDGATQ